RIFEKVHSAIVQTVEEQGGVQLRLFRWAFGVGDRVSRARREGRAPGRLLRAQHSVADRLVLSKVRARLGGRIRFMVSGSAALSEEIARWFHAAQLVVIEGYALTETGGGACIGDPEHPKLGVVGPPLVGSEVKIAEDGEVHIRGPLVMRGYHKLPEATAEVLTADGWLATGDIGELDEEGRLRVTDRKKDLIKTSGGKYIAPQPIENEIKTSRYVSQAVVVGNKRKYASVLIVPNFDNLIAWARHQGIPTDDREELLESDAVQTLFDEVLEKVNAGRPSYETIKRFRLLPQDFTIDAGELTPTLKVKRGKIEQDRADLIDTMYEEEIPAGSR
ncbi:MAG TPA: AMP-binding protein, partial [Gemmatimonadota bacterium]